MQTRRNFIAGSGASLAGAALAAAPKDDISLAAWSINQSFFQAHRWTNLELPRICREELKINGLEFVNQFFENPTLSYLRRLKRNGEQYGITFVRIMVDGEDSMAGVDKKERMDAAIAHRKWVDIAQFLGCTDIRCNMRGGLPNWKEDKGLVDRAAESFGNLLEYARGSNVDIVIENHGGSSSDPDVLVALMKRVNNPHFGVLPDFGNVNAGDDHAEVLRKLLPYAKGVSVKASWQPDGRGSAWDLEKLIQICLDFGYHGWWGVESSYRTTPATPGPRAAGRGAGGGRAPEEKLSPDELWANEVKGVMLTKAVLERMALKKKG